MHPLVATEGEVTVLRKLAACAYGTWKVDWPESVPDENRPVIDDDREFGYVSRPSVEPSRMGRRFVRADVSITAAEYDGSGVVPYSGYSDVESTLDNAHKRTDGDVFLEREITRAGLGRLEPYVDFEVGDVVPVLIWDKVVDLVVRQIEAVTELGAVVNWRVYVGGELVEDSAERERANLELTRQIAEERRNRLKELGAVESRVSAAVVAEREARVEALKSEAAARDTAIVEAVSAETVEREKADAALSQTLREGLDAEAAEREKLADDLGELATTSKTLVDDMGKVVTTADFEQYDAALQADLWLRQQAQNELNADFQEQQSALNVLQGDQISTLNAVQTVLAVGRVGFIAIPGGSGGGAMQVEDAFVRKAAGSMSVEAKGAWVGQIAVISPPADSYGGYGNGIAVFDVTASDRYFDLPGGAGLGAVVFYRIAPSTAYAIELRDSSLTVADGRSWVAVPLRKTDGSTVSYFEVVDPGSTLFYGGAFATMSVPFSVTVQVVQTVGSTTSVLWEQTKSAIQYTPSNGASFYKASGFFRLDGSNAGSPAPFVKGGRVSVRAKVSADGSASVGMEYGAKFSFIQDNV